MNNELWGEYLKDGRCPEMYCDWGSPMCNKLPGLACVVFYPPITKRRKGTKCPLGNKSNKKWLEHLEKSNNHETESNHPQGLYGMVKGPPWQS